jgi:hypothetical protein
MFGFSPMGVNSQSEARQNGFFAVSTNVAESVYSTGQASIGTSRFPRLAVAESWIPIGVDTINFGFHDGISTITYAMTWRFVVPSGDTIANASVNVSPEDVFAANLVISGSTISWQIGAGMIIGNTYLLTCGITTQGGISASRVGSVDAFNQPS